ncbi:MAG: ImmA/IrrE family metallo-endopeptidase [Clostridia bacterium]|nr:ImmA/IrrE family metallo-endopeptidase [Clostridia bacterium]
MKDHIFAKAESLAHKYATRDPFEILEMLGAVVILSERYARDGLKGYCTIINRTKYAVVNARLPKAERTVAAAHELGHLVLHSAELMAGGALVDSYLSMNSGRLEREADMFAADFLLDDAAVTECILSADADFFKVARILHVPQEFLAFKLYSMVQRGAGGGNIPIGLYTDFLSPERGR